MLPKCQLLSEEEGALLNLGNPATSKHAEERACQHIAPPARRLLLKEHGRSTYITREVSVFSSHKLQQGNVSCVMHMHVECVNTSNSDGTALARKGAAATEREQRARRRSVGSWRHLWCGKSRVRATPNAQTLPSRELYWARNYYLLWVA